MRSIGFLLVLLGFLALLYGGTRFGAQRVDADTWPAHELPPERPSVPFAPIGGAAAIAGGLLVVVMHRPRAV